MATNSQFWKLRCSGPGPYGRWKVEPEDRKWFAQMRVRLCRGRKLRQGEWPEPAPVFRYTCRPTCFFDDLLWPPHSDVFIVSDRLRAFLEVQAPDAAEFCPIQLEGPSSADIPYRYWTINWRRIANCLHQSSMAVRDSSQTYAYGPIIDPTRVSRRTRIAPIRGYQRICLVRACIKDRLEEAGFHGLSFTPATCRSTEAPEATVAARGRKPRQPSVRRDESALLASDAKLVAGWRLARRELQASRTDQAARRWRKPSLQLLPSTDCDDLPPDPL